MSNARLLRARRTLRVWLLTARNGARFLAHRTRRLFTHHTRHEALDSRFAIRTSEDVARELGNMKGALMKFGQLLSFIVEALPPEAQAALATLQADAPPMSPAAAEGVVRSELGAAPQKIFLDWHETPVAAASVGQVHRAVTRDGRDVAVKVQYPGVGDAIETDLANTEGMYRLVGAFALKGLDTKGLVDELRHRMRDELDYRLEADNQREFAAHFAGHPFVSIPGVDAATSTQRVLTTEWVEGIGFTEFLATANPAAKRRAGESIWRFTQHAIHHLGAFNGDPHPGNYRFTIDGDVTFLDFGLVKRWTPGQWEQLLPTLEAVIVNRDPEQLMAAMEDVGFLRAGHGLAAQTVWDYVSTPYTPYLTDTFAYTRDFTKQAMATIIDVRGPHAEVIERLNMPPSFVILDRVVWGVNAILGKLEVAAPWRAMLLEYLHDGPPATPMGEAELAWRAHSDAVHGRHER
ncbi:MAG TPA: AarF/ABC1/UbiB kinase family protein [Ilumatobacteraceae bacterium]|nr:AarF/ABC1/UbiB kinase family protein [Ilumatobacteraceae bacterium]